jgi:hypothetical protein
MFIECVARYFTKLRRSNMRHRPLLRNLGAPQIQGGRAQVGMNLPPLGLRSFWRLSSADPARTAR